MKTIRLFCANGFSTAMMCGKIAQAAEAAGCSYDVRAFPYSAIKDEGARADFILLGPQIRYNLQKARELFPDKPVEVMDALMYGQMDGKAAFDLIQKEFGHDRG